MGGRKHALHVQVHQVGPVFSYIQKYLLKVQTY